MPGGLIRMDRCGGVIFQACARCGHASSELAMLLAAPRGKEDSNHQNSKVAGSETTQAEVACPITCGRSGLETLPPFCPLAALSVVGGCFRSRFAGRTPRWRGPCRARRRALPPEMACEAAGAHAPRNESPSKESVLRRKARVSDLLVPGDVGACPRSPTSVIPSSTNW